MSRIQGDLTERTFRFACQVLDLIDELPHNVKGWEIGRQLVRSGTSVGSNVHEADNAFSDADFAHKCSIARKEATETCFWLRLSRECRLILPEHAEPLQVESAELVRILSTIVMRTEANIKRK